MPWKKQNHPLAELLGSGVDASVMSYSQGGTEMDDPIEDSGEEVKSGPAPRTPPYVSFQTFLTLIEELKTNGLPPQIDRSVLRRFAGGVQSQLFLAQQPPCYILRGPCPQNRSGRKGRKTKKIALREEGYLVREVRYPHTPRDPCGRFAVFHSPSADEKVANGGEISMKTLVIDQHRLTRNH